MPDAFTWHQQAVGPPLLQILIDGKTVGGLDRNKAVSLSLPAVASDSAHVTLDILVEGLGRDNSGSKYDFKGLVSEHVLLDGEPPQFENSTAHDYTVKAILRLGHNNMGQWCSEPPQT